MTKNIINPQQDAFDKVYQMISDAKSSAWLQVNRTLINLYWNIGEYVSNKVEAEKWGKGVIEQLSKYILSKDSSIKGFSPRNIWRMKQFYEAYAHNTKLSALLTVLSWTNHLHILSKTTTNDEKEFYLNLAANNRYSERDFARMIDSATFERTMLANQKLPAPLTEFPMDTKGIFKDTYIFEFLDIPDEHTEYET